MAVLWQNYLHKPRFSEVTDGLDGTGWVFVWADGGVTVQILWGTSHLGEALTITSALCWFKSHTARTSTRELPSQINNEPGEGFERGDVSWDKFHEQPDMNPTIWPSFSSDIKMSPCFSNDAKQLSWTRLCSSPDAWHGFIRWTLTTQFFNETACL